MVLAPSFVLAEVKWFGGQNRQTGIKNDFGFAESAIGVDVFIHKSVVDGSLSEGQFVLLKIEKSQKGYSATKCIHDPIKSQSGIMLELIDKDNDYLNTTWKNRLRRQVKDNIPADYFTTLSPDNLVPSIEDLYGDELETMSEFTPWVEDYEIDSEGIKVIEIINLLIKNKPVESVPEQLMNFIFKLPLVILPRLERFSELIKIDIIRERFIDFFKEKDVQERVIAEKPSRDWPLETSTTSSLPSKSSAPLPIFPSTQSVAGSIFVIVPSFPFPLKSTTFVPPACTSKFQ